MFNRLRASIAGEPSSPEKSPHPPTSMSRSLGNHNLPPQSPPPQQRPGFLPPFFLNPPANGSESSRSVPPTPQAQERGFFGGLLQQQSPNPEASPGSIRASAAALLKLATPPLGDSASEINPNALHYGLDSVDLDKRETIEHQINRRDGYISKLQTDLHKMTTQLSQYQKDTNTLRRQQLESTHRHGIAVKLWRRTNDGLQARVECFENETTPTAAREIANLIRDAAPPNKDSAYLMMLQDQLQKATVKLDHLGSQTEIVLHKGEEVVESLREEMNEVIRERCRMELELLDQEHMLEDDMRRMVIKTERRLRRVQGEIDFLEKNAVECLKNQGDEDGSDRESGDEDGEKNDEGASDEKESVDDDGKEVEINNAVNEKESGEEETDDGDSESSGSRSSDGESTGNSEPVQSAESEAKHVETTSKTYGKDEKKEEQTPEILRKELRKLAMERDRTLSVLQKKLREKNEEYHSLMQLKKGREKAIHKFEDEKRDREEWARSREDMLLP